MVLSLLGEGDGMGWDELIFLVWFAGLLEFYVIFFLLGYVIVPYTNKMARRGRKNERRRERKKED